MLKRLWVRSLAVACGVLIAASAAWAWPGRVVRVQDGDSVLVAPADTRDVDIAVRLYGIDAPELHQKGGAAAHRALQALLPIGREVEVQDRDTDSYGRTVGLIIADGQTVNLTMLQKGQAWFNSRFCKALFCREWKAAAKSARNEKKGLWAAPRPEAPWDWRRRNPQKGR